MTSATLSADASPLRIRSNAWTDPDDRMSSSGAFRKRLQRMAHGAFRNETALVDAGPLCFGIERLEGPIRVHGSLPDGALYASVARGIDLSLDGNRVERPTLHVYGAGAAFDATTRGAVSSAMLVVRREALCNTVDSDDSLGEWFDGSRAKSLRPGPEGARFAGLLTALAHQVDTDPQSLLGASRSRLLDGLLSALRVAVAASPADDCALGPVSRRRLALSAEEMILSADTIAQPSVESLCRTLSTSERTLQLAFQEQFGINIRSFIQTARLQKAHSMILSLGDRMTLTEIAMTQDFWHLGRFARYYRETFGCAPSITMRRVWGDQARLKLSREDLGG
jgi:AraC family ethanolamine operon transcriptional activator